MCILTNKNGSYNAPSCSLLTTKTAKSLRWARRRRDVKFYRQAANQAGTSCKLVGCQIFKLQIKLQISSWVAQRQARMSNFDKNFKLQIKF